MYKKFSRLNQKALKYFKAHPVYNSFIHMFIGAGAALLIVDLVPGDLNIIGISLIVLGVLAHLIPILL